MNILVVILFASVVILGIALGFKIDKIDEIKKAMVIGKDAEEKVEMIKGVLWE